MKWSYNVCDMFLQSHSEFKARSVVFVSKISLDENFTWVRYENNFHIYDERKSCNLIPMLFFLNLRFVSIFHFCDRKSKRNMFIEENSTAVVFIKLSAILNLFAELPFGIACELNEISATLSKT